MFMDILSIEQVFLINIQLSPVLRRRGKKKKRKSVTTTRPSDAAEGAPSRAPCEPMGTPVL